MRLPSRRCSVSLPPLLCAMMLCVDSHAQASPANPLEAQAILLHHQGRYPEAIDLEQRALNLNQKPPGPERAATATSLNKLAEPKRVTADYANAEPLGPRALLIPIGGWRPLAPEPAHAAD